MTSNLDCSESCQLCCTELNILKGNLKPFLVTVSIPVIATDSYNAIAEAREFIVDELKQTGSAAEVFKNANSDVLNAVPWGLPAEIHMRISDILRLQEKFSKIDKE